MNFYSIALQLAELDRGNLGGYNLFLLGVPQSSDEQQKDRGGRRCFAQALKVSFASRCVRAAILLRGKQILLSQRQLFLRVTDKLSTCMVQ